MIITGQFTPRKMIYRWTWKNGWKHSLIKLRQSIGSCQVLYLTWLTLRFWSTYDLCILPYLAGPCALPLSSTWFSSRVTPSFISWEAQQCVLMSAYICFIMSHIMIQGYDNWVYQLWRTSQVWPPVVEMMIGVSWHGGRPVHTIESVEPAKDQIPLYIRHLFFSVQTKHSREAATSNKIRSSGI